MGTIFSSIKMDHLYYQIIIDCAKKTHAQTNTFGYVYCVRWVSINRETNRHAFVFHSYTDIRPRKSNSDQWWKVEHSGKLKTTEFFRMSTACNDLIYIFRPFSLHQNCRINLKTIHDIIQYRSKSLHAHTHSIALFNERTADKVPRRNRRRRKKA